MDGAEKITINHISYARAALEFIDTDVMNQIDEILTEFGEIELLERSCNEDDIDFAIANPEIKFDDDVMQFKNKLNEAGITMSKKVTVTKDEKISGTELLISQAREIKEALSKSLLEQPHAIEAITDAWLTQAYMAKRSKPRAVFLLAGPSSVGKTYCTTILAKQLKKYGYTFTSFQMGNYTSDNQQFVMTGLSKGYGTAKEGELTSFVKENPKSIILFEGIDRTHPNVLEAVNEALDYGYIIDKFEKEKVDFTETILIFETNGGREIYTNNEFLESFSHNPKATEEMLFEAIGREKRDSQGSFGRSNDKQESKPLLPESFLQRMREYSIVLFGKLTFDGLCEIAQDGLKDVSKSFDKAFEITTKIKDRTALAQALVLNSGPDFNIRFIKEKSSMRLLNPVNDLMRDHGVEMTTLSINISKLLKVKIDEILLDNPKEKIVHSLFRKMQTLDFEIIVKHDNNECTITLDHPQLKRVKKAKDFGGKNGLIIDLPEHGFEAIAGHEMVKTRLSEVVEIFKNREFSQKYREHLSRGVLLYGPPGTGKTMLARAFAKEADLPFISTTGSELRSSSKRIEEVFALAREYAPSIIFIDEIDVFKHRNGSEADATVNTLLTAIDGFSQKEEERIFIIAATNLPKKIDGALIRSGRIDLHIEVDQLNKNARRYFVDKMLADKQMFSGSIDPEEIVRLSATMSGADLAKLERESIMAMFRGKKSLVDSELLIEQINTMRFGSKVISRSVGNELERTAYHEAGHAVAIRLFSPKAVISQATIVPRGNSAGFVARESTEIEYETDKEMLQQQICISLAGRVVESIKYGENKIGAGAMSDITSATRLAYGAIAQYGMDDELKNFNVEELTKLIAVQNKDNGEDKHGIVPYLSEKTARLVQKWIDEATQETHKLMEKNWDKVESVAEALLAKETLSHADIEKIL